MKRIDSVDRDITILVVDDQQLTRSMVKSILKGIGFSNVILAENGHVAIEKLQKQKVDLVICDWNMPSATGLDVLRAVRADAETKNLPFLMLTAEAYRENVKSAVEAGVSDYIAKPFTPEILADKIGLVMKRVSSA